MGNYLNYYSNLTNTLHDVAACKYAFMKYRFFPLACTSKKSNEYNMSSVIIFGENDAST